MIVAGLDPSLRSTGVVLLGEHGSLLARAIVPPSRGPARFSYIRDELFELLERHSVRRLAIEGHAFGSRDAHVLERAELGGVLRLSMWERGIAYVEVPPKTLKKYASGNGNADKDEVKRAVTDRWGFTDPCDDVVDAYVLARFLHGETFGHEREDDAMHSMKTKRVDPHAAGARR